MLRAIPRIAPGVAPRIVVFVRSEKLQIESFPNFSNFRPEFCPEFCSEFSPNFSRTFCASFRGRRRPGKIHQKSPPFFNAKFPGKHEKIFTKFFWRAGKVRFRIAQVVRCHSENGVSHSKNQFLNSEGCSENSPELSESSENRRFTPRAFFLKLGWFLGF